jgi:hypothetical protein
LFDAVFNALAYVLGEVGIAQGQLKLLDRFLWQALRGQQFAAYVMSD